MLTLWFAVGLIAGQGGSVEPPVTVPGRIEGPAYSPNSKAALEVYRLLFGKKERPSKKRRKIARLEEKALELLNDFRSEEYQPIDLTSLNLALAELGKRPAPKQKASPSEKIKTVHELLEEAERLRREIEQDDEEILLMLSAQGVI